MTGDTLYGYCFFLTTPKITGDTFLCPRINTTYEYFDVGRYARPLFVFLPVVLHKLRIKVVNTSCNKTETKASSIETKTNTKTSK